MARSKSASVAARSQGGGLWVWLVYATVAGVLVVTALPALCLFLPSLLVLLTERDPSRPLTRAVLLFGLAGAWQTLALLWRFGGMGLSGWSSTSWMIALDSLHLATAWAAQGAGWLLAEGLTIAFAQIAEARIRKIEQKAEIRKTALRAAWIDPTAD